MSDYRELLIGCGHSREKRIVPSHDVELGVDLSTWRDLTTLDNNPTCTPDVLCNLEDRRTSTYGPNNRRTLASAFPEGNTFNEIHAYEVLEHCGRQGDVDFFFWQFGEFWRILRPNGYFCATVPDHKSPWAWGDPGHTRIIHRGTLMFLDPQSYVEQLGKTSISDYRKELGKTNFKFVWGETRAETFRFVLQAVK